MSDGPTISHPRTKAARSRPNTSLACSRRGAARGRSTDGARSPFAREVAYWEERLGGMASYVTPVTPPAQTWMRIEASLGAPTSAAAAPPAIWQSLAFWRGLGLGSSAIAAACVAALVYVGMRPPALTAAGAAARDLDRPQDQPAEFRRRHQHRRHEPHHRAGVAAHRRQALDGIVADPGGRQAGIARPDRGRPAGAAQRAAELLAQVGSGATLAVSLEPLGGSPTGQPTGEVIAHGNLTRL